MKNIFIFLLMTCVITNAQVTIHVSSFPSNTPEDSQIYAVGNFNNWDPKDVQFQLVQIDGVWLVTIPEGTGSLEYKFTRGSWSTVEGNADGGFLPNRNLAFIGEPQVIDVSILSWEDLGGTGQSTAALNVDVMDANFYIPQLDRYRKIWIYLPPDYDVTIKYYPVIYMQDGQNLFDNLTAYSGEWKVDETMNNLFEKGDYGAIVIGIENGFANRINEYSPWVNTVYGGGEGELYMQFIENVLKSYVDENYRTKPEAQFTALIGSSMGALISTYGGLSASSTFGKIAAMSPSYWFDYSSLINYISSVSADYSQTRVYFVGSSNESETLVTNINSVKNSWQAKGLKKSNIFVKIDAYGGHNESYWSGEFAAAYQWLFMNEGMNISEINSDSKVKLYYKNNQLLISGLVNPEKIILYNSLGQVIGYYLIQNGWNTIRTDLSSGVYFIRGNEIFSKFFIY